MTSYFNLRIFLEYTIALLTPSPQCDESLPQCHNCIKHSVRCEFLLRSTTPTPRLLHHESSSSNTAAFESLDVPARNIPLQLPKLNMLDLELLYNYSTLTATTLQNDTLLQTIMKINVPELGFLHPFVMRGILALSALHMARLKPEMEAVYTTLAMQHHQIGLPVATSSLGNLTEGNCSAVYIFSTLTLYFTLASPRKPGDILIPGEYDTPDWMSLLKGTGFLFRNSQEWLMAGPFGPVFEAGRKRSQVRDKSVAILAPDHDPFVTLDEFIETRAIPHQLKDIYTPAINSLRRTYAFLFEQNQGLESSDIFIWFFRLEDEYLEVLRQRTQEALIIYAYSSVILHRLDHHWWLKGWALQVISTIFHTINEDLRKCTSDPFNTFIFAKFKEPRVIQECFESADVV